jgi:hypothetical protein
VVTRTGHAPLCDWAVTREPARLAELSPPHWATKDNLARLARVRKFATATPPAGSIPWFAVTVTGKGRTVGPARLVRVGDDDRVPAPPRWEAAVATGGNAAALSIGLALLDRDAFRLSLRLDGPGAGPAELEVALPSVDRPLAWSIPLGPAATA